MFQKKLILILVFCLYSFSFGIKTKPIENNPEIVFYKIQEVFKNRIPTSFSAEITSTGIKKDIESIPSIYIKQPSIKPKVIIYFDREFGIKIFMSNVAKGIAKQYNQIVDVFKIFMPFIKGSEYREFQKKFSITYVSPTELVLRENHNSRSLEYFLKLDSIGRILSIKQTTNNIIDNDINFQYLVKGNQSLISQVFIIQGKQKKHYIFEVKNYDLIPKFTQRDFLG